MARGYRWEPPIEVVRLGIAEVLLGDRPVAVGRVTLTNEVAGTIDFAACCSVQPLRLRHPASVGRRTLCGSADARPRLGWLCGSPRGNASVEEKLNRAEGLFDQSAQSR